MDAFVLLITFFVVVTVVVRWPHLRAVAAWRRSRSGVLEDAELGFARIGLPSGWRPATLNASASLQAVQPVQGRYLIVISESREDYDNTVTLAAHSTQAVNRLTSGLRILASRGPVDTTVDGFPARQFELETLQGKSLLNFLHTTVEGARAWHQVVCWAPRSQYSRSLFEGMLEGFEELPGPAPRPLDAASAPVGMAPGHNERVRRIGF